MGDTAAALLPRALLARSEFGRCVLCSRSWLAAALCLTDLPKLAACYEPVERSRLTLCESAPAGRRGGEREF